MNIVHLTDCMEFMAEVQDDYYKLAIVDPPYGIGNFSPKSGSRGVAVKGNYWDIKWNNSIPGQQYFDELRRISINRIIWGANYYNCFENGHSAIVWHKGKINPQFSQCEIASYSRLKKVDYYFHNWQGGGNWHGTNIHPCQKPVALYKWLLKNYVTPGDKIFDSHVGSGSIRIACHDLGFDFEGCEIDEDYWKAQEERYKIHVAQGELFEISGGEIV